MRDNASADSSCVASLPSTQSIYLHDMGKSAKMFRTPGLKVHKNSMKPMPKPTSEIEKKKVPPPKAAGKHGKKMPKKM